MFYTLANSSAGTQVFNDDKLSKGFAKGVASARRFRQCIGSCNFSMQCPISSKLHIIDEGETLNLTGRQPFRISCEILSDSSYTVDPIPTKLGEPVLKASTMKNYQKLLHKLKGVASPAP